MHNQLPHRRMEAWKWTDVRRAVSEDSSDLTRTITPHFDVPEGVNLSQGDGHKGDTPMSALAANVSEQAWNIYVPQGATPTTPLKIDNLSGGHARVSIMVDKGASLMIEDYHNSDGGQFSNIDLQIHVAEGASLTRVTVQEDAETSVRVATACVAMDTGAKLSQFTLSFGGAMSRLETCLYGEGDGIEALVNGAYLLDGKRHTDLTSHMNLQKPGSLIRQSVKGVVSDKARGVFQGKFHVEQAAQLTDAEMRHDALMLSDTAQVRAKPELEIYADDVACAHGNTIGALDESALFYMRQRGIPEAQARALLTEAFVADVFDDLDDEALRESLIGKVRDWLESRS